MTNTDPAQNFVAQLPGDVSIPLLGFGTWQLRGDSARDAVGWALETGYRHLDTATAYGNETQVGAAVRESGLDRDDIFITTKLPPDHAGQEESTLKASLDGLGVDHLDLWLIHWPPNKTAGIPTWEAFIQAKEDGKTRSIGVSNYSLSQLDELIDATGVAPAVNQIKWGPALFDAKTVDGHLERGVALEGYSPFRVGPLDHPTLNAIAEKYGKNTAQVILRWHLQHGFIAIPKSAHQDRIRANFEVFDFELTQDELESINGLTA
ncbi:aldo/keto reductase [Tenggerimyces flavus]|uniref:Aldo/keto reductase n=1 Tax=Tenggerimyces flavus TaxID=1708749 RepID=A0ABV7Y6U9_9ACTN|nr:aldo/keto reductase [Tenggerimyces flavus]MBM7785396.1 diketogulonate reductase-like aldo/keto reductase [Tenggerimyces flavus]